MQSVLGVLEARPPKILDQEVGTPHVGPNHPMVSVGQGRGRGVQRFLIVVGPDQREGQFLEMTASSRLPNDDIVYRRQQRSITTTHVGDVTGLTREVFGVEDLDDHALQFAEELAVLISAPHHVQGAVEMQLVSGFVPAEHALAVPEQQVRDVPKHRTIRTHRGQDQHPFQHERALGGERSPTGRSLDPPSNLEQRANLGGHVLGHSHPVRGEPSKDVAQVVGTPERPASFQREEQRGDQDAIEQLGPQAIVQTPAGLGALDPGRQAFLGVPVQVLEGRKSNQSGDRIRDVPGAKSRAFGSDRRVTVVRSPHPTHRLEHRHGNAEVPGVGLDVVNQSFERQRPVSFQCIEDSARATRQGHGNEHIAMGIVAEKREHSSASKRIDESLGDRRVFASQNGWTRGRRQRNERLRRCPPRIRYPTKASSRSNCK